MYEVILISISFLFGAGFTLALQAMLKKKVDAPMPLPFANDATRRFDTQMQQNLKYPYNPQHETATELYAVWLAKEELAYGEMRDKERLAQADR